MKPKGEESPLWKGGRKLAQKRWNDKESSKKKKSDYYYRNRILRLKRAKEREDKRKILVMTYYGDNKCACIMCGESDIRCLSIDHIEGGGAKHRHELFGGTGQGGRRFYYWLIKNNYPKGYQTLCMNCQFKKEQPNL